VIVPLRSYSVKLRGSNFSSGPLKSV
jgi:hypothetical protein